MVIQQRGDYLTDSRSLSPSTVGRSCISTFLVRSIDCANVTMGLCNPDMSKYETETYAFTALTQ